GLPGGRPGTFAVWRHGYCGFRFAGLVKQCGNGQPGAGVRGWNCRQHAYFGLPAANLVGTFRAPEGLARDGSTFRSLCALPGGILAAGMLAGARAAIEDLSWTQPIPGWAVLAPGDASSECGD